MRATFRSSTLLFCLITAIIYTFLALNFSKQYYRLGIAPSYDDIGYLNDAHLRLKSLYEGGVGSLAHSVIEQSPHSPWSTGLALAGFCLLGERAESAYYLNFILVALFLYLAFLIANPQNRSAAITIAIMVLGAPLTFLAVIEFRPDFASNLFLASGSALLFFGTGGGPLSWRRMSAVCLLFTGALLAKPTTVIATGGLIVIALALYVVDLPFELRKSIDRFKSAILATAGLLVLSGWYYILNFRHYYLYITQNLNNSVYSQINNIASLKARLAFYVVGTGAIQLYWHYLLIAAVLLGALVIASIRCDLRTIAVLGRALIWSIAAYLGTSLAGIANHFFGLNFQIMLVFMAAAAWVYLFGQWTMPRWRHLFSTVSCALALVLAAISLPPRIGLILPDQATEMRRINNELLDAVSKYATAGKAPQVLFLTVGLNANPDTFEWLARQHHINARFVDDMFSRDMTAYTALLNASDLVITSDLNAPGLITATGSSITYPYVAFLPELENTLRSSGHFTLFREFTTSPGASYRIFVKK